uniref:N-acetyltransferase domain-containing protein n=1 Tax=Corethron hystrix TaxID=216773 RepID=A0A7S1FPS8_9STRA|mmetsp:Transcript_21353/g.48503  ORF Transcript_21353/g.48503 Transcript_21353/m.48503 type:complete len:400 (+) Transcript_21353:80-1279(+)
MLVLSSDTKSRSLTAVSCSSNPVHDSSIYTPSIRGGIETGGVTLSRPAKFRYLLRGLTASEVPAWTYFCASCFSYKDNPPPASYFARHYHNDPQKDCSLIRVAFKLKDGDNEGLGQEVEEIVSSVRIFLRTVSNGNDQPIRAAGIGEVCTSSNHRRQGLAGALLSDALRIVDHLNIPLSMLHAAPEFRPNYEKVGFRSVRSAWTAAPFRISSEGGMGEVRDLDLSDNNISLVLANIHRTYSESRLFGCIVRSDEYWQQYLPQELGTALVGLHIEGTIVGYMSLMYRSGRYQLREFGADLTKITTSQALRRMLLSAIRALGEPEADIGGTTIQQELLLPQMVWEEVKSEGHDKERDCHVSFDLDRAIEANDDGWMWRGDKGQKPEWDGTRRCTIWPSDNF